MTDSPDRVKALQDRTKAKLRYAGVHLDEMKKYGHPDGGDFDRAHQESFLFHLLGACDALLAEINVYYNVGLSDEDLSPGNLQRALKSKGEESEELAALHALECDETSWYSTAKAMRNHSTHVGGVPRAYFMGGESHGKVKLKHPKTGKVTEEHFPETFREWLALMEALVERLRNSALYQSEAGSSSRRMTRHERRVSIRRRRPDHKHRLRAGVFTLPTSLRDRSGRERFAAASLTVPLASVGTKASMLHYLRRYV